MSVPFGEAQVLSRGFRSLGRKLLEYWGGATAPRIILWSYLIWYVLVLVRYFEPSLTLWLNSLGISAIIGTGLYLSTSYGGTTRTRLAPWQVFRLYLMPLCVSSFAALIKGHGFVLIFHPTLRDNALGFALIGAFVTLVSVARARARTPNGRARCARKPAARANHGLSENPRPEPIRGGPSPDRLGPG